MAEKINFEETIEELEKIVKDLEKGDVSLDEAMELFEKGVKLTGKCTKLLDNAEQKVVKLIKDANGEMKEEPFETQM